MLEVKTKEKGGAPLFTNRFSLFLRGEGGFGGEAGPKVGNEAPERTPDATVESRTLPQQALLYRLSATRTRSTPTPSFAKIGGFDTPILHGLCSFGIVCKAVVDHALGGDVSQGRALPGALRGRVLPGRDDGHVDVARRRQAPDRRSKSKERGRPVISNAAITLR